MSDGGLVYDGFELFIELSKASEIRKEILKMDEFDRCILMMLGEGYTQAEAAKHIGISAMAVCKRVKNIRNKLKMFCE